MDNEKEFPKIFDSFLFPKIFQTFRIAIQPSKLIIAFASLAVICLSGWALDFSRPVLTSSKAQGGITELQAYIINPDRVKMHIEYCKVRGGRTGVFSTLWRFGSEKFHGALQSLFEFDLTGVAKNVTDCFKALLWAVRYHPFYSIVFLSITLAVFSLGGGGICRIAALQFAGNEKPGLTEALRFSVNRFMSFFTVPLAPIGVIICIGLFIFLLGLIGNIPRIGELIIGIFMLPALIAGTLITIVLIGTAAGFNLMFPAIVYDGSDCFDALSRSFSYVYSKPWRMGFYTAIAAVYGAACYMFVRFFTFLLLWITRWFLQVCIRTENSSHRVNKLTAIWPEPSFMYLRGLPGWVTTNWSESLAIFLIHLALLVVVGLLVSFVISFYFSANTIIYALMRNRVDNTALQEIYTSAAEAKSEPIDTASYQ